MLEERCDAQCDHVYHGGVSGDKEEEGDLDGGGLVDCAGEKLF